MKARDLFLILMLGTAVSGCAAPDNQEAIAADDPLEPMNRFFFEWNQKLDRHAALPAATFYSETIPQPVRASLHNVLTNLGEPVSVANDILEIRFHNAGDAAARFIINSTVGVAGIFDVAADWDLPEHNRDFGETMGGYGMPAGPYLVLPFRGPTTVRDFAGNFVDGYLTPFAYLHMEFTGKQYVGMVRSTIGSMDNRANNIVTYQDIERSSVDFYATMRAYYHQRRQRQIEDTQVQTAELPDF
jgi:phospholipid-binding lipoprotein MlaA